MRRHAKATFVIAALCSFFGFAGQALAVAPTVTIDPGPTATVTTIQGTGTVDPGDQEVGVYVEFATSPGGPWGERLVQSIPANAGPTPVSYEITGLAPETQYYIRLDAWTGAYNLSTEVTATTLDAPDAPSVTLDPPSAVTASGAHFSGEVNTATGPDPANTTWRFQCMPECPGLSGGLVTAGNSATVEADASGLVPGTTYLVSLVAENPGNQRIAGPESFTTLSVAPSIESTRVEPLRTEAVLSGSVNPGGAETSYHFEYGPTASYGQSTAAKPLPAGTIPVAVKASIRGLTPRTSYHFRLVADNANGTVEGPDRVFTTEPPQVSDDCPNAAIRGEQGTGALANCRAYEMVSPLDKNNGDILFQGTARGSADGDALEFETSSAFGGAQGAAHSNQYIARRSAEGWTTEAVNPYTTPDGQAPTISAEGAYAFNPGLTRAVLLNNHDPADGPNDLTHNQRALYLWNPATRIQRISPQGSTPGFFGELGPIFAGSDAGFGRFFFESAAQLLPEAPPYVNQAYEWHEGQVRILGVLPNGEIAAAGAMIGAGASSNGADERRVDPQSAISPDGTELVLTMGSPSQLYLARGDQRTLITASQRAADLDAAAAHGASFLGTATSGSKLTTIYFASPDLLTEDATGEPEESEANELYAYDVASGHLTFLSKDSNSADPPGAKVVPSFFEASSNGDFVYFISTRALTADAPTTNRPSLYFIHDGSVEYTGVSLEWFDIPTPRTTRLSVDGRRLLMQFRETADPDRTVSVPTVDPFQLYLFDAPTRKWTCVSCRSDGTTTHVGTFKGSLFGYGGLANYYRARNLSPDGRRAYFETAEALVPADVNGVTDVYEWDEGKLNLVSTGASTTAAHFLDATADGSDVFIATRERLLPGDVDANIDVYDARVDGGNPEVGTSPCQGDSCQAPANAPPGWRAGATGAVVGAGNRKPRRPARCTSRKTRSAKAHRLHRSIQRRCSKRGGSGTKRERKPAHHRRVSR